jgi:ABC-type transporter Mla MlaB component
MGVIRDLDRSMVAPSELGLQTRSAFRESAYEELASLTDGGTLRIDLAATRKVDSAGLSALWLIHRRAAERMQRVVLCNARDEVRYLLALTELDGLFEQD